MNKSHRFLALAFTLALASASLPGGPGTAHAQTVSPNPAPTIITSAPYTITTAGYYQLGANLSYSGNGTDNDAIITVNASNVTLDFAGHKIAGPTTNANTFLFGVYAYERSNLLIQNGTVAYCFIGIEVGGNGQSATNALNARVLNMTLTKCYSVGAYIYATVNPEISNCRVSAIGGSPYSEYGESSAGFELTNSQGGKVTNCSITNVTALNAAYAYGIRNVTFASGNTISNCRTGISGASKYQNNLTDGCSTSFDGGTDAGGNN